MPKRILMVGTYPIAHAIDGGQLRARALCEAYRRRGHEAQYVGIFFKGSYEHWSAADIPVGVAGEQAIPQSPFTVDLICSEQLHLDSRMRSRFEATLRRFKPDVVQIEQAFPAVGVCPLLDELRMRPRIVFSSHNVEHALKREILEGAGWSADQVAPVVQRILDIEQRLAADCDLLIAVSEDDAEAHRRMGARHVVIARNGADRRHATADDEARWRRWLRELGGTRLMLFVGSAHPPNWTGWLSMVGTRLGFVPPETRIALVGGIARYMVERHNREVIDETTMWRRLVAVPRVTQADLGALLRIADVILLPITGGGGSNLKTAEAILSGRNVVGTPHAFRAFESLTSLPNIHLARTPEEFRDTMLRALRRPPQARTEAQQREAESVLWEHCLSDAVDAVSGL